VNRYLAGIDVGSRGLVRHFGRNYKATVTKVRVTRVDVEFYLKSNKLVTRLSVPVTWGESEFNCSSSSFVPRFALTCKTRNEVWS